MISKTSTSRNNCYLKSLSLPWRYQQVGSDLRIWMGLIRAGSRTRARCFIPFRHLFKDALRAAKVPEDLNDALMGQATRGSVGRRYGARDIVTRYGMPTLIEAVERVAYSGLDLSGLRPSSWAARPQASRPTHGRRKHHRGGLRTAAALGSRMAPCGWALRADTARHEVHTGRKERVRCQGPTLG